MKVQNYGKMKSINAFIIPFGIPLRRYPIGHSQWYRVTLTTLLSIVKINVSVSAIKLVLIRGHF